MFQPENSFVFRKANGTGAYSHVNGHGQLVAAGRPLTLSTLLQCHFTVEASDKVLKTVDI